MNEGTLSDCSSCGGGNTSTPLPDQTPVVSQPPVQQEAVVNSNCNLGGKPVEGTIAPTQCETFQGVKKPAENSTYEPNVGANIPWAKQAKKVTKMTILGIDGCELAKLDGKGVITVINGEAFLSKSPTCAYPKHVNFVLNPEKTDYDEIPKDNFPLLVIEDDTGVKRSFCGPDGESGVLYWDDSEKIFKFLDYREIPMGHDGCLDTSDTIEALGLPPLPDCPEDERRAVVGLTGDHPFIKFTPNADPLKAGSLSVQAFCDFLVGEIKGGSIDYLITCDANGDPTKFIPDDSDGVIVGKAGSWQYLAAPDNCCCSDEDLAKTWYLTWGCDNSFQFNELPVVKPDDVITDAATAAQILQLQIDNLDCVKEGYYYVCVDSNGVASWVQIPDDGTGVPPVVPPPTNTPIIVTINGGGDGTFPDIIEDASGYIRDIVVPPGQEIDSGNITWPTGVEGHVIDPVSGKIYIEVESGTGATDITIPYIVTPVVPTVFVPEVAKYDSASSTKDISIANSTFDMNTVGTVPSWAVLTANEDVTLQPGIYQINARPRVADAVNALPLEVYDVTNNTSLDQGEAVTQAVSSTSVDYSYMTTTVTLSTPTTIQVRTTANSGSARQEDFKMDIIKFQ